MRGLPLSKHPTLECLGLLASRRTRKVAGDFILFRFLRLSKAWMKNFNSLIVFIVVDKLSWIIILSLSAAFIRERNYL